MPRKKIEKSEVKLPTEKTEAVKPTMKVHKNFIFAVGRRKRSIARVRLIENGKGEIQINEKDIKQYFPYFEYMNIVLAPLSAVGLSDIFNVTVKVSGGGIHSQAEAVRHAISRALLKYDKNVRKTLKPLGYLTRDPREKERKKPGLKRARRAPQFSKR